MPVPFSKNTTDQAVSPENKLFVSFLLLYAFGSLDTPVRQLQLALLHQRVFLSKGNLDPSPVGALCQKAIGLTY